MTTREEIRQERKRIHQRIRLWDRGANVPKTVGAEWERFGETEAEVRTIPSLCNRHQSVVLVRAPEGADVMIRREAEAQGIVILATSDADNPRVLMVNEDSEDRVLTPGEAITMNPVTPLHIRVQTGNVMLMLIWRPGLASVPCEPRLYWSDPPSAGDS